MKTKEQIEEHLKYLKEASLPALNKMWNKNMSYSERESWSEEMTKMDSEIETLEWVLTPLKDNLS